MKTYILPSIISHDIIAVTLMKNQEIAEDNSANKKMFGAHLGFGL